MYVGRWAMYRKEGVSTEEQRCVGGGKKKNMQEKKQEQNKVSNCSKTHNRV